MKKLLTLFLLLFALQGATHATPQNLYEQLCEVNQEWHTNRAIAEQFGYLNMPVIKDEQDLLVFHIQALEQIFSSRPTAHLAYPLQQARAKQLQTLRAYYQRRDCPRNYYLPYRNPVFIDHEGRYCAVGYLMLKSGKKAFCEAVQKNSNFIYIRAIESKEFHDWQKESGLTIDELAWIQPGYMPQVHIVDWDKRNAQGKLIELDSISTLKIYQWQYDNVDMFGMQMAFFQTRYEPESLFKKVKNRYQGTKPNWNKLPSTSTMAMDVYKGELYVAIDTMAYIDDAKMMHESYVMRWGKKNTWEKVLDLEGKSMPLCFFQSAGKLYVGGGKRVEGIYDEKTEIYKPAVNESFVASFNGKTWQVSKEEYGGYVFGLIYKNKKRYLVTAYNAIDSVRKPVNSPKN